MRLSDLIKACFLLVCLSLFASCNKAEQKTAESLQSLSAYCELEQKTYNQLASDYSKSLIKSNSEFALDSQTEVDLSLQDPDVMYQNLVVWGRAVSNLKVALDYVIENYQNQLSSEQVIYFQQLIDDRISRDESIFTIIVPDWDLEMAKDLAKELTANQSIVDEYLFKLSSQGYDSLTAYGEQLELTTLSELSQSKLD